MDEVLKWKKESPATDEPLTSKEILKKFPGYYYFDDDEITE